MDDPILPKIPKAVPVSYAKEALASSLPADPDELLTEDQKSTLSADLDSLARLRRDCTSTLWESSSISSLGPILSWSICYTPETTINGIQLNVNRSSSSENAPVLQMNVPTTIDPAEITQILDRIFAVTAKAIVRDLMLLFTEE